MSVTATRAGKPLYTRARMSARFNRRTERRRGEGGRGGKARMTGEKWEGSARGNEGEIINAVARGGSSVPSVRTLYVCVFARARVFVSAHDTFVYT